MVAVETRRACGDSKEVALVGLGLGIVSADTEVDQALDRRFDLGHQLLRDGGLFGLGAARPIAGLVEQLLAGLARRPQMADLGQGLGRAQRPFFAQRCTGGVTAGDLGETGGANASCGRVVVFGALGCGKQGARGTGNRGPGLDRVRFQIIAARQRRRFRLAIVTCCLIAVEEAMDAINAVARRTSRDADAMQARRQIIERRILLALVIERQVPVLRILFT